MPKIVKNPELETNIRFFDHRLLSSDCGDDLKTLAQWYENGDLIVLTHYRFGSGVDIFNRLLFPNEKRAKKLMLHKGEEQHGTVERKKDWAVAKELLTKSDVTIEQFEAAVCEANQELISLVEKLFPLYPYKTRLCIYNISEMLCHNMHFDSPQHAGDMTQLRAFVNLDQFPRIWRLGRRLEEVAGEHYRNAGLRHTIGDHPREFTRATTQTAFGNRYNSGNHSEPMHSIAFQPGEVWFLNPNMTAHEVVYGRRLLDAVFMFEKDGLLDKKRFYPNVMREIHSDALGDTRLTWIEKAQAIKKSIRRFRFRRD